ncbi:MAG TPA: hypothetical protein V6C88_08205, partial [Chroococcidiopsis sp.]
MTDTLLHAYTPLLVWTGLGLLIVRFLPKAFPRFLGRGLYWVGVPLQIFTLARQTDWSGNIFIAPTVTFAALLLGLVIIWLLLQSLPWLRALRHPAAALEAEELASGSEPEDTPEGDRLTPLEGTAIAPTTSIWDQPARRGSLFLATMLGNTGFVGLAVVPTFLDEHYLGWIVFYSVAHNLIGTYGMGVFVASYFSRQADIHLGSNRQSFGQRW